MVLETVSLPQTTFAAVIGIERYSAGPTWDIDGPASDAVRFLEFLGKCGVPRANVWAFLAPLLINDIDLRKRAAPLARSVDEPTDEKITSFVTRDLPAISSETFFFFWSGHGIITIDGRRLLFTSDAIESDKRNLDLNGLMATLRTDRYPNLERQAFVVDACANYFPSLDLNLPSKTFPQGDGIGKREQFALFAAAVGEYAKSVKAEKAGILTRELMAVLSAKQNAVNPSWPPDLPEAAQELAERFIALRRDGKATQTPTTLWLRDWRGTEQSFKDFKSPVPVGPLSMCTPRRLNSGERTRLRDALTDLRRLGSVEIRDELRSSLRKEIYSGVKQSTVVGDDLMYLLDKCRSFPGGLAEFIHEIEYFERRSGKYLAFEEILQEILPEEMAQQNDDTA